MKQTTDVVVVGGGVIGCYIAYELARAGLEVIVVEKEQIGAEASSASAGLLVPMSAATRGYGRLFDLYLASLRCFPQVVPELEQETGIRVEYDRSGVLRVALDEAEEARLLAQYQGWQAELDMELVWLDKAEVHALEPELAPAVCGGILAPEEAAINSGRLTLALARAAANRQACFWQGCLTTGVQCSDGRFVALQTSAGEIAAGQLVIAAGAWSRTLCDQLGLAIPIAPARGQMLSIRAIRRRLQRPVMSSKGGMSPKADGAIYVGGTVDLLGFNKQIRPENTTALLATVSAMMPGLLEEQIDRMWTGLRPYCQDELPVIGLLPGWENIAIAAGHYQLGITGCAITARIIKDLLVSGQSEHMLDIVSPARFKQ
jgi:glycine oxidase